MYHSKKYISEQKFTKCLSSPSFSILSIWPSLIFSLLRISHIVLQLILRQSSISSRAAGPEWFLLARNSTERSCQLWMAAGLYPSPSEGKGCHPAAKPLPWYSSRWKPGGQANLPMHMLSCLSGRAQGRWLKVSSGTPDSQLWCEHRWTIRRA